MRNLLSRALSAAFLAVCAASAWSATEPPDPYAADYAAGAELHTEGKLNEALDVLLGLRRRVQAAMTANPGAAERAQLETYVVALSYNFALLHADRGECAQAVSEADAYIESGRVVLDNIYQIRGYCRLQLGDAAGALRDLDQLLRKHPEQRETVGGRTAHALRGDANFRLGRYRQAVADYTEGDRRTQGGDAVSRANRGLAYQRLGKLDAALSDLSATLPLQVEPIPERPSNRARYLCGAVEVPAETRRCPDGGLVMFIAPQVTAWTPEDRARMNANLDAAAKDLARKLSPDGAPLNAAQLQQLQTMNCLISAAYNPDVRCVTR